MAFLYSYGMLWRDYLPPIEHLFDYDLDFDCLCSRRGGSAHGIAPVTICLY